MVQWFRKINSERPDSFVFYAQLYLNFFDESMMIREWQIAILDAISDFKNSRQPTELAWSDHPSTVNRQHILQGPQAAMGFNCKLPSTKLVFDVPTDLNDVLIQTKGLSLSPWWLCHRFLLRGRTCRLGRGSLALRFLTKVSTLVFTKFILRFSIIIRTNFLNYHQN